MPWLTPAVRPKSSALTISRRAAGSRVTRPPPRLLPEGTADVLAHVLRHEGLPPAVRHRVLEQLEVEQEGRRRLLAPVELEREHALLVGLGEHGLRAREGAVLEGDCLERVPHHPEDALLHIARHRPERA